MPYSSIQNSMANVALIGGKSIEDFIKVMLECQRLAESELGGSQEDIAAISASLHKISLDIAAMIERLPKVEEDNGPSSGIDKPSIPVQPRKTRAAASSKVKEAPAPSSKPKRIPVAKKPRPKEEETSEEEASNGDKKRKRSVEVASPRKRQKPDDDEALTKPQRKALGSLDINSPKKHAVNAKIRVKVGSITLSLGKDDRILLHDLGFLAERDVRDCAVYVTNAATFSLALLAGLCHGPAIVDQRWLTACIKQKSVVDTSPFELRDDAWKKTYEVDIQYTLARARVGGTSLFSGRHIFLSPGFDEARLEGLTMVIEASGGTWEKAYPTPAQLRGMTQSYNVIAKKEEKNRYSALIQAGIPIHFANAVVRCVLEQTIDKLVSATG